MKKIIARTLLSTILATSALSTSVVVMPESSPAMSQNIFKKIGKDLRKARKGIQREFKKGPLKQILPVVGTILIANGIADGSPAAIIFGAALVAAPQTFQKDMARKYSREMQYSGCTSCGNKRVVLRPGQKITSEREKAIRAEVKEDIKDVQRALAKFGYYTSKIDGDYGPGSRRAAKKFQAGIGTGQTGILNAEERYLLFTQAAELGYVREARDLQYSAKVIPAVVQQPEMVKKAPVIVTPTIAEFRLAKSQFDKFSKDFLQGGDQSTVKSAELLPDGRIKLQVEDDLSGKTTELVGTVAGIDLAPHRVSDLWIRVTYEDDKITQAINLNTRDDFDTLDEASAWMSKAKSKLGILAELTEVEDVKPKDDVLIADAPKAAEEPIKIAGKEPQTPKIKTPSETENIEIAEVKPDNKQPKIATEPTIKIAKPEDQTTEIAKVDTSTIAVNEPKIEPVPEPTTISVTTPQEAQICQQNLFVNFDFPVDDENISHFIITPPEGAVWYDRGDTTSNILGQCVQGTYKYEYVSITKGKTAKDWKDNKFTGEFQIASNAESCSISLDDPTGSAGIRCFQ
ncbi:MAG: peptidoglycan-binding domain-containing protein [Lentilitoribacter sp.]